MERGVMEASTSGVYYDHSRNYFILFNECQFNTCIFDIGSCFHTILNI